MITKAETGERPPTPDVLAAWCTACHLDDDLLGRLAKLARSADGPVPAWFETYLEAEREAVMLRYWQPIIVPGLFQTAGYARALFVAVGADDEQAGDLVRARLDRQAILERAEPPHVVTVLDEAVLHRLTGSPQIMTEQLGYLAERATLPHVSVQVLPAENGAAQDHALRHALAGDAGDAAHGAGQPPVVELQRPGEFRAFAAVGAVPFGGQGGETVRVFDGAGPGVQLIALDDADEVRTRFSGPAMHGVWPSMASLGWAPARCLAERWPRPPLGRTSWC